MDRFVYIKAQNGFNAHWSMSCIKVLVQVARHDCLLWVLSRGLNNPLISYVSFALCEYDWSLLWACMGLRGEKSDCLCEHAHVYPAPRWSRIRGMQQNAICGLELGLITNRWVLHFARLNITHAARLHMKENAAACTIPLQCKHIHSCSRWNQTLSRALGGLFLSHGSTATHHTHSNRLKLSHVTRPLSIKIFVCKWSVNQIGELMATGQAEHLRARVLVWYDEVLEWEVL